MSNIFVISDTWFNRLIEDDPNENVVDRNERIIQVWNNTIKKNEQRRSFVHGITEYKGVFYSVYSARTDERVILLPITVKAGVS